MDEIGDCMLATIVKKMAPMVAKIGFFFICWMIILTYNTWGLSSTGAEEFNTWRNTRSEGQRLL